MNEELAVYALSTVPQIGPRRCIALVSHFETASDVLLASSKELMETGILNSTIIDNIKRYDWSEVENEYKEVLQKEGMILNYFSENYPQRLKNIPDPPIILFSNGQHEILNDKRSIAIVGTRKPSSYGVDNVKNIINELKCFMPHIVSGLAFGIDILAHQCALAQNLPTTAVFGNGLDRIYPFEHRHIANQISKEGCLLSEYGYGVKAEREHFPMRNRIVAGLCDLTIVVESGRKGGSMITAWMANEYQREVVTFPGSLNNKLAAGPHHLIKNHQAHLIEDASDIIALMRWDDPIKEKVQLELFQDLNEEEKSIIELLNTSGSLHIDELSFKTKLTSGTLALHLLQLEMKGCTKSLPGNKVQVV